MHKYYKIYKPYGVLSQFVNNQNKRRNKKLLSDIYDLPPNTMAIGRLDEKSEGLLLLTTNGKFSEYIRSQSVEKEYHVMVDGIITDTHINQLTKGIDISINGKSYQTKPCKAHILNDICHIEERFVRDQRHGKTSWLSITIAEGKFRQVRKMTSRIGLPTLRLVRVRIGDYRLENLTSGKIEEINCPHF
ncbi:pseudouridine synthase [Winogradskyella litorisediminis]|uniref:Pseudouridine synthase n=1 Tax=Winogradskyella litorisediminis TaxID=1156618 RepID=A0ABW3N3E3_9FLAO